MCLQIFCGIVHTFAIIQIGSRVWEYNEVKFEDNPALYLGLLRETATFFQAINLLILLWTKFQSVLNVVDYFMLTFSKSHWNPSGKSAKVR